MYKDLANTIQQDRAHFLASSKLYDAAYTDVRNRQFALLVEDTTCRKVFSDDFTKYGEGIACTRLCIHTHAHV